MTDVLDFVKAQRARLDKLRKQAEDAAREAEQLRRFEHAEGAEIVGVHYPWVVRPAELPISLFELDVAFSLANGDLETASVILKVSTDRLRRAIAGTKYVKFETGYKRRQQSSRQSDPPVTAIERPGELVVTIRKPSSKQHEINLGFDEANNLVVTVRRASSHIDELIKRAVEILNQ